MNLGLTAAIINGVDKLGAKKLAEELVKRDIGVFGIGGDGWWGEEAEKIEFRLDVEDVETEVNYIFDFNGEEKIGERAFKDGAKLTLIKINEPGQIHLPTNGVEARGVELNGVYGEGMEPEGMEWLDKALRLAVMNKNLILPKHNLRLLAVDDAIEAILRATFLSGTMGEIYKIWGEVIPMEEVAKTLIEEAKMTRYKVMQEEGEQEEIAKVLVESNWQKLRWKPRAEFKSGIKELLQEYFVKIDEESRKKISGKTPLKVEVQNEKSEGKQDRRAMFEAVVEEEKKEERNIPTVEVEEEIDRINEPVEVENENADTFEEIKPILGKPAYTSTELRKGENYDDEIMVKNSNVRPVASFIEEEPDPIATKKVEIKEETGGKDEEVESEEVEGVKEVKKVEAVGLIPKTRIKQKKTSKTLATIGVGLLTIMAAVIIGEWLSMYSWWQATENIPKLIEARKYDEAVKQATTIENNLNGMVGGIEGMGLNRWGGIRKLSEALKVWRDGVEVEKRGVNLAENGDLINEAIFKDKDIDWNKTLADTGVLMADAEEKLGLVEARLGGDWSWLPTRLRDEVQGLKNNLGKTREMITAAEKVETILPDLIGTDGKRKEYMVLFQNESELRPGGGFIGSYGILSFEGGKLNNLEIKDVYEADGQLKGHVEPPAPIKNYLGEAAWYMRDANWDPNFTQSAKDIKWFLEKETGRSVDGVIGINLAVAKAMLEVTGPVSMPDFKEKINKDNLYEQAEFYSEKNFFPGSNQKASFLGALGKQLFEEIKNLKPEDRLKLMAAMYDKLNENEIQITVNTQSSERVLSDLGWNGMMYSGKCTTDRCFADYLQIVEANVGVNKANYFLLRNVDQVVDIQKNAIARVLKITYENTAKNSNWPGGNYKNYLRIYIPGTANIAEVSVTDPKGGKTVFEGDNLETSMVGSKKEIGFLVEVPYSSRRIVQVSYNDQINLDGGNEFSYLQYIQKQSGFGDTGWVSLVNYPTEWQVTQVQPEASMVNGKLLFNQKLTEDIRMGVEISK